MKPYDLEGQSSKDVIASIIYSSGTTGLMKGVKISHYNHIINLLQGRSSVPLRQNSEQRVIFFAPCKTDSYVGTNPSAEYMLIDVRLSYLWIRHSRLEQHVVWKLYMRPAYLRSRDILSTIQQVSSDTGLSRSTYCTPTSYF